MMPLNDPWQGDWRARVYERVRAGGYADVTAVARAAPAVPYRELAATLGRDIAPVQLEKLLRAEAIAANRYHEFARDCLARYLRQDLPLGWGQGTQADFNAARAFASWSAALHDADNDSPDNSARADEVAAVHTQTHQVWQQLRRLAPPGWLAQGADDPVLLRAFRDFDLAPRQPTT